MLRLAPSVEANLFTVHECVAQPAVELRVCLTPVPRLGSSNDDLQRESEGENDGCTEEPNVCQSPQSATIIANTGTTIARAIKSPAMKLPASRNLARELFMIHSDRDNDDRYTEVSRSVGALTAKQNRETVFGSPRHQSLI